MTDILTFGLVQQTNRSGVERTTLLKEVEGTYTTGYECEDCDQTFTESEVCSGSVYRCTNCSTLAETEVDTEPSSCDDCSERDFNQIDGDDGTEHGRTCKNCYAGRVTEVRMFTCDECNDTVNEDDAEEHLFEHLEDAW